MRSAIYGPSGPETIPGNCLMTPLLMKSAKGSARL